MSKVIRAGPGVALARSIASRSEQTPWSMAFVTTKVDRATRPARISRGGRNDRRRHAVLRPRRRHANEWSAVSRRREMMSLIAVALHVRPRRKLLGSRTYNHPAVPEVPNGK